MDHHLLPPPIREAINECKKSYEKATQIELELRRVRNALPGFWAKIEELRALIPLEPIINIKNKDVATLSLEELALIKNEVEPEALDIIHSKKQYEYNIAYAAHFAVSIVQMHIRKVTQFSDGVYNNMLIYIKNYLDSVGSDDTTKITTLRQELADFVNDCEAKLNALEFEIDDTYPTRIRDLANRLGRSPKDISLTNLMSLEEKIDLRQLIIDSSNKIQASMEAMEASLSQIPINNTKLENARDTSSIKTETEQNLSQNKVPTAQPESITTTHQEIKVELTPAERSLNSLIQLFDYHTLIPESNGNNKNQDRDSIYLRILDARIVNPYQVGKNLFKNVAGRVFLAGKWNYWMELCNQEVTKLPQNIKNLITSVHEFGNKNPKLSLPEAKALLLLSILSQLDRELNPILVLSSEYEEILNNSKMPSITPAAHDSQTQINDLMTRFNNLQIFTLFTNQSVIDKRRDLFKLLLENKIWEVVMIQKDPIFNQFAKSSWDYLVKRNGNIGSPLEQSVAKVLRDISKKPLSNPEKYLELIAHFADHELKNNGSSNNSIPTVSIVTNISQPDPAVQLETNITKENKFANIKSNIESLIKKFGEKSNESMVLVLIQSKINEMSLSELQSEINKTTLGEIRKRVATNLQQLNNVRSNSQIHDYLLELQKALTTNQASQVIDLEFYTNAGQNQLSTHIKSHSQRIEQLWPDKIIPASIVSALIAADLCFRIQQALS